MRLALTGRNLTVTPALRQVVTRRLDKLDRLLHGTILSAQVALQVQKDRVKTDLRVRTTADQALSAHGEAIDARASILDAIAKVEHQASRVKGKWDGRKRLDGATRRARVLGMATEAAPPAARSARTSAPARAAATGEPRVIRMRRTSPKPMRLEDAVLRVDATAGSVLVFRDAALDRVQILIRRGDGHLGLIDPDA